MMIMMMFIIIISDDDDDGGDGGDDGDGDGDGDGDADDDDDDDDAIDFHFFGAWGPQYLLLNFRRKQTQYRPGSVGIIGYGSSSLVVLPSQNEGIIDQWINMV